MKAKKKKKKENELSIINYTYKSNIYIIENTNVSLWHSLWFQVILVLLQTLLKGNHQKDLQENAIRYDIDVHDVHARTLTYMAYMHVH